MRVNSVASDKPIVPDGPAASTSIVRAISTGAFKFMFVAFIVNPIILTAIKGICTELSYKYLLLQAYNPC